MITNPVIVTSLFDIGRDTWDNFKVSYHTYLWWMKNTLAIDANFVIYTDNRFYEDIIKMRQEEAIVTGKPNKCMSKRKQEKSF